MIQHNPDTAQPPRLQRPDPPASLLGAVRVMYAGALACAVHAVVYLATTGVVKAIGMTPRQTLAMVGCSAGGIGIVAGVIAIPRASPCTATSCQ